MPPTLRSLQQKTHAATIEIEGEAEPVTVWFSTYRLTARVQEEIAAAIAEAGPDSQRPVIRQFLSMVDSWDFAADDGEPPIPLAEEALMDVPIEILGAALNAITEKLADLAPKEATGS